MKVEEQTRNKTKRFVEIGVGTLILSVSVNTFREKKGLLDCIDIYILEEPFATPLAGF